MSRKWKIAWICSLLAIAGGWFGSAEALAAGYAAAGDAAVFSWTAPAPATAEKEPETSRREHAHPHGERWFGMLLMQEAAQLLDMDKHRLFETLRSESLADIAEKQGMKESELMRKLRKSLLQRINREVSAGHLDKETAKVWKSEMNDRIGRWIHRPMHMPRGMHRGIWLFGKDKLAAILGITGEELQSELKQGKTLAEIAESRGMSKRELVDQIKEEMTPWIEKMVERKMYDHKETSR